MLDRLAVDVNFYHFLNINPEKKGIEFMKWTQHSWNRDLTIMMMIMENKYSIIILAKSSPRQVRDSGSHLNHHLAIISLMNYFFPTLSWVNGIIHVA